MKFVAWLLKVELSGKSAGELKELLDATKYADFCASSDH